jgi:exodeoxyribonuclease-3
MMDQPLRVVTLNLNGIRSAASKGLEDWVAQSGAQLLCVQELKAQPADLAGRFDTLAGLRGYFHCADKKGYAGVGIYAQCEPSDVIAGIGVPEFDAEGRYLELRFDTPARRVSVVSVYFPSGSSGDERQQAKYRFLDHIAPALQRLLADGRQSLVCGDLNIAHTPKDLKNWRSNQRHSGFLPQERAWLSQLLASGWVDVYRQLYPDAEGEGYTWWSNRGRAWEKNVGWRIDYHLASPALAARARSAFVFKAQRFSDHAPLVVDYAAGGLSHGPWVLLL